MTFVERLTRYLSLFTVCFFSLYVFVLFPGFSRSTEKMRAPWRSPGFIAIFHVLSIVVRRVISEIYNLSLIGLLTLEI